ncbi:uncharacterized protein MELLADRAFT_93857 [Melampsora larici-populina 98AG31]|uniref:Uncharacterized protein n=1 Tax=Melampsora larici-populina (strain 98AG31 / pathotype 3-4-7) TaxID=747676 RepID=F4S5H8_MELLP|nr:uncharacterized protein MELLADRAFT_93857 [Melampsora larici-populina 98AG31]EGG00105.1 hypothetical protein MELLADRAFT_93857 [Melampsora larici-populina 98AG31]
MTKGKKTKSQPNSAKTSGADNPTVAASDPHKIPPQTSFPNLTQMPSDQSKPELTNAHWLKVQTLDDDLKIVFLVPGVDITSAGVTCLKLYRILIHFNPKSSSRPSHRKDKLWAEFAKDVVPILMPHMLPPPPAPMQTETSFSDFNPLSRKTTRPQLISAVRTVNTIIYIPTSCTRDSLLVLYKAFIDKDLPLPWLTEFIKSPNIVKQDRVKDLCMEELRMTLQEHAPHVFIHLPPMNDITILFFDAQQMLDCSL